MNVDAVRADTPGCREVAHFDNAGSALPPSVVTETVIAHLRLEERLGGYAAARQVADRLDQARASVARLIHAQPGEVALVDSATTAWTLAFGAVPLAPGARILVDETCYASCAIAILRRCEQADVTLEVVPSDEGGAISLDALEWMLDSGGVGLVAATHAAGNSGLIQPIAAVGARTRAARVPLLVDACQSVGQRDVDVRKIRCQLLSFTGRKYLRGPRGTGALFVSEEFLEECRPAAPDLFGARWTAPGEYALREDARRFEQFERSVASQLGLGAAAEYAMGLGLPAIERRVESLAADVRGRLSSIDGVRVHDIGHVKGGLVTFTVDGCAPEGVRDALAARGVHVSVTEVHTTRLDMERRGLGSLVRASVHYYNDEGDVGRLVEGVRAL